MGRDNSNHEMILLSWLVMSLWCGVTRQQPCWDEYQQDPSIIELVKDHSKHQLFFSLFNYNRNFLNKK